MEHPTGPAKRSTCNYALVIAIASLAALLIAASCNPVDSVRDDGDAESENNEAPTREVSVSTFDPENPPTREGDEERTAEAEEAESTPEFMRTAAAEQTAIVGAATANPDATVPDGSDPDDSNNDNDSPIDEENFEGLEPPQATLDVDGEEYEGILSSFNWQFNDEALSLVQIIAPIVTIGSDPLPVDEGAEMSIRMHGSEYRRAPETLEARVFDFEENSAVPMSVQDTGDEDELAFAVKTEPDQRVELDPREPAFDLDVPPGRYSIQLQGNWGPHPQLGDSVQILVIWVFDIDVQ